MSPSEEVKKEAEALYRSHTADGLPMEALGLLLTVFGDTSHKQKRSQYADELARYINLHAQSDEAQGTAHYPSFYAELERHEVLHSSLRVDAIILQGLVTAAPESPLIMPMVKGLLARRRNGVWYNTQENAWAIIALDTYYSGTVTLALLDLL